jgi:hypothetical protein
VSPLIVGPLWGRRRESATRGEGFRNASATVVRVHRKPTVPSGHFILLVETNIIVCHALFDQMLQNPSIDCPKSSLVMHGPHPVLDITQVTFKEGHPQGTRSHTSRRLCSPEERGAPGEAKSPLLALTFPWWMREGQEAIPRAIHTRHVRAIPGAGPMARRHPIWHAHQQSMLGRLFCSSRRSSRAGVAAPLTGQVRGRRWAAPGEVGSGL